MATDILDLIFAFAFGAAIGLLYFTGLWWTVQRLPQTRSPGFWMMSSYFIRTAIAVFAFYFAMDGHWQRLLVSLLGFVMIRIAVVHRLRPAREVRSGQ